MFTPVPLVFSSLTDLKYVFFGNNWIKQFGLENLNSLSLWPWKDMKRYKLRIFSRRWCKNVQFLYGNIYLFLSLYLYLCIYLHINQFIYLSICLSNYLYFIFQSISLYLYLSSLFSIYLTVYLSIFLSIFLFLHFIIYSSINIFSSM
jgi:hypothetical protein